MNTKHRKWASNRSLRDWNIKWIQREEGEVLPLCFPGCDEACHSSVWLQYPAAHDTSARPGKTPLLLMKEYTHTHTDSTLTHTDLCRALSVLLGYICYHGVLQERMWISVSSEPNTGKIKEKTYRITMRPGAVRCPDSDMKMTLLSCLGFQFSHFLFCWGGSSPDVSYFALHFLVSSRLSDCPS